ncbi:MAG: hypothetical protein WC994_08280 [Brumimicrobium sp.]
MKFPLFNLLLVSTLFIVSGCAVSSISSSNSIIEKEEKFQKFIESHASSQFSGNIYQSTAYGPMKMYKPQSFVELDSLYRIKQQFVDNNDFRGLKMSGIDDVIPTYKEAADKEIHQIEYEIEHLYQLIKGDTIEVHHDFYLFDYEDKFISRTPFFNYSIPKKYQDFYYAYEFGMHFIDNRPMHISTQEQQFLRFFKNKAFSLIREPELDEFMTHTMKMMETAFLVQSVDFREISKKIVLQEFINKNHELTINNISPLFALKEGEQVLGYELNVDWLDELEGIEKITKFVFSPYLEIQNKSTLLKE